ncbi:uncharacterized protein ACH125_004007, partial [Urocitellus parryii]
GRGGRPTPSPPTPESLDFYILTPRYCSDLSSWGPAPGVPPSLVTSNQHSQTPEADRQMGRWAEGQLGLGQHHSRDKASAYANWGISSLFSSPVLALARPCYTNLPFPLSLLPLPTPLPPSPILPLPDCSTQEEEASHSCAQFLILKEFGWGAEQGILWSEESFWCLSSHPPQPSHPIFPCLLSSSWVHVVIKKIVGV